jgi:hypothetical protein
MAGGSKGMAGGGGRTGSSGGLWAVRPGGEGAAGRVVEDNRWVVSAAGANDDFGYDGWGGTPGAGGGRNGTTVRSLPAVGGGRGRRRRSWCDTKR